MFSALAAENPAEVSYIGHLGYLGQIAARTGDVSHARSVSDRLERVRGHPISALATYERRSCIAALLGERQRAVELLRDALAQGLPYGLAIHNNPDFEILRDYQPYLVLVTPDY